MKKVLSWLLVCAMLLSLPLTLFAEEAGEDRTPVDIPAKNMGFLNGGNFLMYDPDNAALTTTGDTIFKCDGNYFSLNKEFVNAVTGAAVTSGVLQSRKVMPGDYELTYEVKLNDANKDKFFTMFYWQDYTENGRSYQTSARGVGLALKTEVDGEGNLTFVVQKWAPTDGKGTPFETVATGSAPASSNFLKDAAAGQALSMKLQWKDRKLTVSACKADDATATTGDVIFDLSGETTYIDAVKDPAGFAIQVYDSSFGKFALKDLTEENSSAVEISLVKPAFLNGNNFYMYDSVGYSADGSAVVNCDGTYFTVNKAFFNPVKNTSVSSAVLQSRKVIEGNYDLNFEVKLNDANTDDFFTMFHWQDYTENGRSYQTSQRGIGFSLRTQIADGKLTFSIFRYAPTDGKGAVYNTVATGSAPATSDFLTDAAAGQALTLKLQWEDYKLTVSACKADDASATTGNVIFDLSGEIDYINAVKDPAGFAILMGSSSYGKFSVYDPEYVPEPPTPVEPEGDWTFSALDKGTFNKLPGGNNFVLGEDGWFTRTNSTDVATDVGAITYNKKVSYNYELTFHVKMNADNSGRLGIWNIWDGNFSGTHVGYMVNLATTSDGKLNYRLVRYAPAYSLVTGDMVTSDTEDNVSGSEILIGQPGNAELVVTVTVKDQTIELETHLASDPSKSTGNVKFDLSVDSEKLIHRAVDRTLGFAFIDMGKDLDDKAVAPLSIGKVEYKELEGEPPAPEIDDTDYNGLFNKNNYGYSGTIGCTTDNFEIYSMNSANVELFSTDANGWFTRTNANGDTTGDNSGSAYAQAQYKGVMDPGDYRLTFTVKANENNRFRVFVMTRWEDKDGHASIDMKSQTGYRVYFRVEENGTLEIRCNQTTGGYLAPVPATKDNAISTILQGLDAKNVEVEITLVMSGSLILAEAHLAGDSSKSTGVVAFNTSDNPNLFGQIDMTQGFVITDAACEYKIEPASIGNIKISAAKAPVISDGNGGDEGDPDDNLPDPPTKETTDKPEQPTTPGENTGDTTGNGEKGGCKSTVAVSLISISALSLGAALTLCRKKKKD